MARVRQQIKEAEAEREALAAQEAKALDKELHVRELLRADNARVAECRTQKSAAMQTLQSFQDKRVHTTEYHLE